MSEWKDSSRLDKSIRESKDTYQWTIGETRGLVFLPHLLANGIHNVA